MEQEPIFFGNVTLSELVALKPFGWKIQNPPVLTPYKWEILYPIAWKNFPEYYQHASFFMGALYVLTIPCLQRWMKNRPAFNLKKLLCLWNLAISVGTIFGVVRCLPGFLHVLRQPDGFYRSVCLKEGADFTMAFWGVVFVLSKFVELGDTVFIILRKRPLKFLHWYHHLCSMLVIGTVAPMIEPISRWYGIINGIAHSFVYPYFTFKGLGINFPPIVAKAITSLQLLEMFFGFIINMSSLYFFRNGHDCARYSLSINAFSFVYGTFILLFGKLFYDVVIRPKRKGKGD